MFLHSFDLSLKFVFIFDLPTLCLVIVLFKCDIQTHFIFLLLGRATYICRNNKVILFEYLMLEWDVYTYKG